MADIQSVKNFVFPRELDEKDLPRMVISVRGKAFFHFPIPQGLSFTDGIEFTTFNNDFLTQTLTSGIRGVADSLTSGGDLMEIGTRTLDSLKNTASNAFNKLSDSGHKKEIGQMLAARYIDSMGGTDLTSAIGNSAGVAYNPNTTLHMKGPKLRTFTFSFQLISNNMQESLMINEMLDLLEKYRHPSHVDDFFLSYPEKFNITFYNSSKSTQVNTFIPRIEECFLTDAIDDINKNTNMFHLDGSPVERNLTLVFRETKTRIVNDIPPEKKKNLIEAKNLKKNKEDTFSLDRIEEKLKTNSSKTVNSAKDTIVNPIKKFPGDVTEKVKPAINNGKFTEVGNGVKILKASEQKKFFENLSGD